MEQKIGTSHIGDLSEAVKGFINPSLIILLSNKKNFEEHVAQLEQLYPGTPSIGCICISYNKYLTIENGVTAIAFSGQISVATNVILELSSAPVKYIRRIEDDIKKIGAESKNTICIDFCTGNDSRLMTTLGSVLESKKLSLIGDTVQDNIISCNGVVYENACSYAFIKNNNGKIKAYKENIYRPTDLKMVVTSADPQKNILKELNNIPAQSVYCDYLKIPESKVRDQTFQNPLGKWVGDEIYILSVDEQLQDKSLRCNKRVNNMDIISILELDDYKQVIKNTISEIKKDFHHVSGIFTMNCIFRYLFFQEEKYWEEYLKVMNFIDNHVGLVAFGEHFESQQVNQTMVCIAFE